MELLQLLEAYIWDFVLQKDTRAALPIRVISKHKNIPILKLGLHILCPMVVHRKALKRDCWSFIGLGYLNNGIKNDEMLHFLA